MKGDRCRPPDQQTGTDQQEQEAEHQPEQGQRHGHAGADLLSEFLIQGVA